MTDAAANTDDLKALYQEIILDHSKSPRNARTVEHATCTVKGSNPLCGDRVSVTARVSAAGLIEDVAADAKGCAISVASASLMTEVLKGLPTTTAARVFEAVQKLCTGHADLTSAKAMLPPEMTESVEKLASLSGVRQFPVRVKCATLPWHAMMSCLQGRGDATTEDAAIEAK